MLGNIVRTINQNARQEIQMANLTQLINRRILITSMKPHNNGVVAHTQAEAKCNHAHTKRIYAATPFLPDSVPSCLH